MMPRVYNAPSTSIAVGEHCEPFLCHGCLKMVTPCIVEIKEVVMVCMPMHVNDVQVKPPVPAADNEVTEIDPADTVVM